MPGKGGTLKDLAATSRRIGRDGVAGARRQRPHRAFHPRAGAGRGARDRLRAEPGGAGAGLGAERLRRAGAACHGPRRRGRLHRRAGQRARERPRRAWHRLLRDRGPRWPVRTRSDRANRRGPPRRGAGADLGQRGRSAGGLPGAARIPLRLARASRQRRACLPLARHRWRGRLRPGLRASLRGSAIATSRSPPPRSGGTIADCAPPASSMPSPGAAIPRCGSTRSLRSASTARAAPPESGGR